MRGAGGDKAKAFDEDFIKEIGHPPVYENATAAFPLLFLNEALKSIKTSGGLVILRKRLTDA